MKLSKLAAVFLIALSGVMASASAFAQHRHGGYGHGGYGHGGHWRGNVGFGLYLGGPGYWGYPAYPYYAAPYYSPYYSPYYGGAASPPVYVEQGQYQQGQYQAAPAQAQSGSWYFCRESNAYYPYVQQCAGQWEPVAPRPQS